MFGIESVKAQMNGYGMYRMKKMMLGNTLMLILMWNHIQGTMGQRFGNLSMRRIVFRVWVDLISFAENRKFCTGLSRACIHPFPHIWAGCTGISRTYLNGQIPKRKTSTSTSNSTKLVCSPILNVSRTCSSSTNCSSAPLNRSSRTWSSILSPPTTSWRICWPPIWWHN